jgi:hypothetical protein
VTIANAMPPTIVENVIGSPPKAPESIFNPVNSKLLQPMILPRYQSIPPYILEWHPHPLTDTSQTGDTRPQALAVNLLISF